MGKSMVCSEKLQYGFREGEGLRMAKKVKPRFSEGLECLKSFDFYFGIPKQ